LDTAKIDGFRSDSQKYSKVFDLSPYEDLAVLVKADDSANAGLTGDSISLGWGYQLGSPTLKSAGTLDTLWEPVIWVDTLLRDSLGKMPEGRTGADLTTTKVKKWIDTSTVTGWAVQGSGIVPEWRPLIRYVVKGLAGNSLGTYVKLQIHNLRRLHVRTTD
jgi:hypothetical protein